MFISNEKLTREVESLAQLPAAMAIFFTIRQATNITFRIPKKCVQALLILGNIKINVGMVNIGIPGHYDPITKYRKANLAENIII